MEIPEGPTIKFSLGDDLVGDFMSAKVSGYARQSSLDRYLEDINPWYFMSFNS